MLWEVTDQKTSCYDQAGQVKKKLLNDKLYVHSVARLLGTSSYN